MSAIIKYILLNGIRDRLYLGVILSLVLVFAVSTVFGSTFILEQQETTAVFGASSSRLIFIFGITLFVCISLNRSFDSKEIEFIISKSISRQNIILAYIIGYVFAAALILVPLILALIFLTNANEVGIIYWSLTLISEALLVIIFAILATLILENVFSSILASVFFYILSRLMSIFVLTIKFPDSYQSFADHILPSTLKLISVVFPRLDLFAQSEWLIYGISNLIEIKIIILQSLIYIPLLVFMSFYDFRKKQF